MRRRAFFAFSLLSLVVLGACSNLLPASSLAPAVATRSPLSVSVFSPVPTATATSTPTPLPHPAAFDEAFARGLVRFDAASGQWRVTAIQTADGGRQTVDDGRQTADFTLLPNTFSTHDDLRARNPLAPYTVRALDENNQEVTLIWNPETAEFRLAYEIPNIQKLIEQGLTLEEIEKMIPVVSPEDFTDGTVIKSVLLAMERDGYQPFSQQAAENYQKLLERNIGPRLHFDITTYDGTHVKGEPLKTASLLPVSFTGQENNQKRPYTQQVIAPYLLHVKIGDENYLVTPLPTLNPADPQNVSPDDYIILFGIPFEQARDWNRVFWQRLLTLEHIIDQNQKFTPFLTYLYAQRADGAPLDPQSPNLLESLLAQLLSIPGNDARIPRKTDNEFNLQVNINGRIVQLDVQNNIIEVPIPQGSVLPSDTQTKIYLYEVGVAQ